jgi:hypothetical protein
MTSWIGWIATALFASSYFVGTQTWLLRLQVVAALTWIGYGIAIGAAPVIVANAIVALSAGFSLWRRWKGEATSEAGWTSGNRQPSTSSTPPG